MFTLHVQHRGLRNQTVDNFESKRLFFSQLIVCVGEDGGFRWSEGSEPEQNLMVQRVTLMFIWTVLQTDIKVLDSNYFNFCEKT